MTSKPYIPYIRFVRKVKNEKMRSDIKLNGSKAVKQFKNLMAEVDLKR